MNHFIENMSVCLLFTLSYAVYMESSRTCIYLEMSVTFTVCKTKLLSHDFQFCQVTILSRPC